MIDISTLSDNDLEEIVNFAQKRKKEEERRRKYNLLLDIRRTILEYNELFGDVVLTLPNGDDIYLNVKKITIPYSGERIIIDKKEFF